MLKTTGVAAAALLAGCSGGSADSGGSNDQPAGDSDGDGDSQQFGGWMADVSNFDGVVDQTGTSEVVVKVGTEGNQGNYAFSPAAVKVSAGTTVTWKWTGEGGSHNVVDTDGDYESDLVDEKGHTFSHTFESAGTSKYYCQPHKAMGMKGVVVVE